MRRKLLVLLFALSIGWTQSEPQNGPVFTDIAHAYHGLLLDAKLEPIPTDRATLEQLQESMMGIVDPAQVEKLMNGFQFEGDEKVMFRGVMIQMGIDAVPEKDRVEYQWRASLIHERMAEVIANPDPLRPELEQYLISINLRDLWDNVWPITLTTLQAYQYVEDCRVWEVPIPPEWPSGMGWTNREVLPWDYNFVAVGRMTEIWTWENADGLCYALPRFGESGVPSTGIICQNKRNGKACFWDNISARHGRRVAVLRVEELKNGLNLRENCTNCHRGANAFLIHPETRLADPVDRVPAMRYSPIGQATWVNPPPMAPRGSGSCSSCHEIGAAHRSYCGVLRKAAQRTMPSTAAPAGWDTPRPEFAAHIEYFKSQCPDIER